MMKNLLRLRGKFDSKREQDTKEELVLSFLRYLLALEILTVPNTVEFIE
jgi:hypothetical protein